MRIGILTVPFNNNYGGFLQAYALKKVLASMGHEVIFINRRRNRPHGLKASLKRLLITCHLLRDKNAEKIAEISIYTNQFKSKYLEPITEEYYTTKELKRCLKLGIDCFVVGSDQVWRYQYAKDSIDDFFFSFLKGSGIPRFSYAASMGTSDIEYPYDKLQICSRLLKEFRGVSVRENSTLQLLLEKFKYHSAAVVLDPTMLLNVKDYQELMGDEKAPSELPYVFTYILDESVAKNKIIDNIAKKRNLKRINMKAQTGDLRLMNIIEPVETWLSAIFYSDFVVTDSFHGTIFSIIFKKPFIVIKNKQRGVARITDLLSRFCLDNRLMEETENVEILNNKDIDWDLVKQRIQKEQTLSVSFLENTLSMI